MGERLVKASIPVAIQPGTRLVHLVYDTDTQCWLMWLHHNLAMQHGTQLILEPGGGIERVVTRPDGTEERFRVR